jgi:hypothetical protein
LSPSAIAPPPRYFWRRALAFFVDMGVAWGMSALLILPFLAPDDNALRLGLPGGGKLACLPLEHDGVQAVFQCRISTMGIHNGRLIATSDAPKADPEGALAIAHHIDGEGREILPFYAQPVVAPLIFLIASALFTARSRRSPGKVLTGLRVRGRGCAMCRETRRGAPLLGLSVLALGVQVVGPSPGVALAGFAGIAVLAAVSWAVALIRWRGAMPYDRATGFWVGRG